MTDETRAKQPKEILNELADELANNYLILDADLRKFTEHRETLEHSAEELLTALNVDKKTLSAFNYDLFKSTLLSVYLLGADMGIYKTMTAHDLQQRN